jgi:hypothetical protein
MGILIKDGNYIVPLRQLKFKGDQILIPVGDIKGQLLPYNITSQEHLKFLKRHYGTTEKTMSYSISKNEITRIEDLESLKEKLFPKPKEKKEVRSAKSTEKPKPLNKPKPGDGKKPKRRPKGTFNPPVELPSIVNKPDVPKKPEYPATVIYVARNFNTFPREILDILHEHNIEGLDETSLLSQSEFRLIRKIMETKGSKRSSVGYIWTEFRDEPDPKPVPSPITINEKQILLTRNVFTKIVKTVSYGSLDPISSYFQDVQARLICSRMSSSFARSIAEKHSRASEGDDKDLLTYQLHYMADKALKVFGGKILTLIYELPPLRFAQKTALEVKTYHQVRPDFPMISFTTHQVQVNVAFFTKLHRLKNKLQPHVFLFKHKTYETIGSIDELGYIRLQLQSFRPELSLFIDRINEKQYKIYSGVQTGVCDICNRPLREPLSLRIGIGPVCAKNIGLDRSEYDY